MKLEEEKTGNKPSSRLFYHIPGTPRRSFVSWKQKLFFLTSVAHSRRFCLHQPPSTKKSLFCDAVSISQNTSTRTLHPHHTIMQSSTPKPSGSTSSSILPPSLLPAAASRSAVYGNSATQSNSENLPPRTLARVARDVRDLVSKPPEGVRLVVDGETGMPNSLSEILVSREILKCPLLRWRRMKERRGVLCL